MPAFLFPPIVLVTACICYYVRTQIKRPQLPLPPGPKKSPFLGNLFDMPTSSEWEVYDRWCREYDTDIIHLDVAGTSIVVLNTVEAATELLDNRSAIYSSRPRMTMVNELMGWDFSFGLMEYGNEWRAQRRLFQQEFNPTAAERYRPCELKATHELLRRLLDDPNKFIAHIRHLAGSTILSIAYGLEVRPENDPYVLAAEAGLCSLAKAAVPGAFLVDSIPLLKYIPDWFPGATFKRKANKWRQYSKIMREMPFEAAKRRIAEGTAVPSYTSYSLEKLDQARDAAEEENRIQSTAATMYTGGTDSTVSVLCTFILAMLANPEAQRKGQEEIEAVLGPGELPRFADEDSLPFVSAVVKEVLRWKNVTPMGIPHALTAEDVYQGYTVPSGSIVIPNIWAMLHDETVYPEPHSFMPERFIKEGKLNPDIRDPDTVLFGFGRRICPARHMAYSSIWIAIASMLAVFDITKATDEFGKIIEPTYAYAPALACVPLPFKCSLKPRNVVTEASIRATANVGV
ncbi:cytochrome P450 [Guyanagaster necrorhizus]|uniref:Cytochrome P450 n=1 Tax=Guyanagaster necrorhizus TaxID=856835 RepID=A0A9P7VGG5_9AGAR|nr:cytochrome P450 [Guyanagaster necrorhizus MCA 3950]KAG7440108.1 cytochrome P450 [Guyanagaster necrorhizus MCA 3950]